MDNWIRWAGRPPITAPGGSLPVIDPPVPERIALRPTPEEFANPTVAGSLWRSGPKSLFGDRRARSVGDILTVVIEIEDEAEISNETTRARSGFRRGQRHRGLWAATDRRRDPARCKHAGPRRQRRGGRRSLRARVRSAARKT